LREYSIPHLRRSGKISIPEESFERIRQARDLHKEGLGTGAVRRVLREGGGPNAGELKERLDRLLESLERLRSRKRPATDEVLPPHAIRTILARQNLLISAMFNLTEMVEELLIASGKPRRAVFGDVEDEHKEVRHERLNRFFTPVRGARFGSLAQRRRRGILLILSALMAFLLLVWALPTMGSESEDSGISFLHARKAGKDPGGSSDQPAPRGEVATRNPPVGGETQGAGSYGSGEAGKVEVPDVSDGGVAGAVHALSRAGFEVAAIEIVASTKRAGKVIKTDPAAGSAVEPENPIVVVMSGGPTGLPPGLRSGGSGGATATQYTP
jgi:hypothetical protein